MTIRTLSRAIPRVEPARADERWHAGLAGRRLSAFAIVVVVVSLLLHAVLLTIALFGAHDEVAPPQEIPIEVVQEAPPIEAPAPKADAPPAVAQSPVPAPLAAKPPSPPPPPPPQPSAADKERAELERQLDALEAEQQALKTDAADLGPLRDSIRAIALPGAGGDDGEVVGYQSLVFSQLAKAKDGAHEAAVPATVGVRFRVDDAGGLVDVEVAVSSGVAELDAESLAIVRRAAPFPKPPAGAEHIFSANFAYAGAAR